MVRGEEGGGKLEEREHPNEEVISSSFPDEKKKDPSGEEEGKPQALTSPAVHTTLPAQASSIDHAKVKDGVTPTSDTLSHPSIEAPSSSSSSTSQKKPLVSWDVEDVCNWLISAGFESVVPNFRENDISGEILPELDNASLKEMDIPSFGRRFKILGAIASLKDEDSEREKASHTTPSPHSPVSLNTGLGGSLPLAAPIPSSSRTHPNSSFNPSHSFSPSESHRPFSSSSSSAATVSSSSSNSPSYSVASGPFATPVGGIPVPIGGNSVSNGSGSMNGSKWLPYLSLLLPYPSHPYSYLPRLAHYQRGHNQMALGGGSSPSSGVYVHRRSPSLPALHHHHQPSSYSPVMGRSDTSPRVSRVISHSPSSPSPSGLVGQGMTRSMTPAPLEGGGEEDGRERLSGSSPTPGMVRPSRVGDYEAMSGARVQRSGTTLSNGSSSSHGRGTSAVDVVDRMFKEHAQGQRTMPSSSNVSGGIGDPLGHPGSPFSSSSSSHVPSRSMGGNDGYARPPPPPERSSKRLSGLGMIPGQTVSPGNFLPDNSGSGDFTSPHHPTSSPSSSSNASSTSSANSITSTGGKIRAPDHMGWMNIQGDGPFRTWKRRWFLLKDSRLYYAKGPREPRIKPLFHLRGARVIPGADVHPGHYGIRIFVAPGGWAGDSHSSSSAGGSGASGGGFDRAPCLLSCDEELEAREWVNSLMKGTIGRDMSALVISSSVVPTIPLSQAQEMRPRPPSPPSSSTKGLGLGAPSGIGGVPVGRAVSSSGYHPSSSPHSRASDHGGGSGGVADMTGGRTVKKQASVPTSLNHHPHPLGSISGPISGPKGGALSGTLHQLEGNRTSAAGSSGGGGYHGRFSPPTATYQENRLSASSNHSGTSTGSDDRTTRDGEKLPEVGQRVSGLFREKDLEDTTYQHHRSVSSSGQSGSGGGRMSVMSRLSRAMMDDKSSSPPSSSGKLAFG